MHGIKSSCSFAGEHGEDHDVSSVYYYNGGLDYMPKPFCVDVLLLFFQKKKEVMAARKCIESCIGYGVTHAATTQRR
jgi:hypothetical protein